MNKISIIINLLVLTVISFMTVIAVSAEDEVDSEGYPYLYLRGSFTPVRWDLDEEYRFQREDSLYSLIVNDLKGEFKIGGTDWNFTLGAEDERSREILDSCEVAAKHKGLSFYAFNENTVKIEFVYDSISVADREIPMPVIFSVPDTTVVTSGTLPVIHIDVRDEDGNYDHEIINKELDHKNYFDAVYWIEIPDSCHTEFEPLGSVDDPLPLKIKGRGNYTFKAFSKKPYKLKLDKKQNLLGLSPEKSKHYALLAHADDSYGYLRNFTGFELGKLIGLQWTPSQTPVELVINGNYRGLYFLTESIRVEKGRIDIQEQEDCESDPMTATGGYVLEIDNYWEDNQIRIPEKGIADGFIPYIWFTFESPEEYSAIQHKFVEYQLNCINDLTEENSDDLWALVDLDDAVRYYLVNEIVSHIEAFRGSTFFYRDRGENQKWHFSPLWDLGNAFRGSTQDFAYNYDSYSYHWTWLPSWLQNDTFLNRVKETWLWFMSNKYRELEPRIREYVELIRSAATMDYERWRYIPLPSIEGARRIENNTNMDLKQSLVLRHLEEKTEWLSTVFGEHTSHVFEEPERDLTEAAPLPDFISFGVGVNEIKTSGDFCSYYNLQGFSVTHPQPGEMLIEISDKGSRKVIYTDNSF